MIRINEHYTKLTSSYLFAEIKRRVAAHEATRPARPLIRLGIGDVTEPLPPACVAALHAAADEFTRRETLHGYGPEQGHEFLREAIAAHDFRARGAAITAGEIFISDGSKCDCGNFQEIFAPDARVALPDPVYPVYLDSNVMAGRTGPADGGRYAGVTYLDCRPERGYLPELPAGPVDLIYLCFPNNPTGAVASRAELQRWVDYARAGRALILFDAAYEAYVRDPAVPRSIFEIEGAREVAVEFRSFSKTAGFTGLRCACVVVPQGLQAWDAAGRAHSVHALWTRRHTTKFNGASYPVQRAAAAVYTPEGREQARAMTDYYLGNAALIRTAVRAMGLPCVGGDNAPYLWVDTGRDSWEFFDHLLTRAGVVVTPGAGFGRCGEGHVRISAFNRREQVEAALERIAAVL